MFDTCINNIYDFFDDILIFFKFRNNIKSNFYDNTIINNYDINYIIKE